METHRERLRQYTKDLKDWKEQRLKSLMENEEFLQFKSEVEFDYNLTKGTMYKYLYSKYSHGFTAGYYNALKDPKEFKDFFIHHSMIVEGQKILKLKQRRDEANLSGNKENVKKYDHAISIELGKFKHSASETYLSPENLKILDIDLSSINEVRVKKLQCLHTFTYLIRLHPWFNEILEELASVGNPLPEAPAEVKQLRKELKNLQYNKEHRELEKKANGEKEFGYAELKLFNEIRDKQNELQIAQTEYTKIVGAHFDYLSNIVYKLKEKEYNSQKMSTKHLEQIIKLFAWFYKRLFKAEKNEYQKAQRDIRNAKRKKSTAFEERKALIQGCKNKGLNKKEAENETGYSYPTVLKYWDLS